MSKDWDWEEEPGFLPGNAYVARRGLCEVGVYLDPDTDAWVSHATIQSLDYPDAEGVLLYDDKNHPTAELAKLAAVAQVRAFIDRLEADFRGAD